MISLGLKRIFHQKWRSLTTIIVMVGILTLVSYGIYSTNEARITVTESLENHSRGSYDLLVRPEGAQTNIEELLGTVEENYIGDSEGGISISEWESLKEHSDIEIAAPVASLGYFTSNTPSITLPALDHPARYEYQFFTSDGIHHYPGSNRHGLYYLQLTENEYLYALDTYDDVHTDFNMFLKGLDIPYPQNFNLLVAIDEESESQLTGIDYSDLYRELTSEESESVRGFSEYRNDAPIIPILQRESFQLPLFLEVKVEEIDLSIEEIYRKYELSNDWGITYQLQYREEVEIKEFERDLAEATRGEQVTHFIDLTDKQSPFDGLHLALNEDFEIEIPDEGGTLYNDSGKFYIASKNEYEYDNGHLNVRMIEEGPPPVYKKVEEAGNSYIYVWEAPFMIWQMGTFQAPKEDNQLISSPLGIYSTSEVTTLDGTTITPTIFPGSFVAAPAAGVTTLEAASLIKGDQPIDAIRVKVSDITVYNDEAQQRIETLANELVEAGYVVDIVAGSSFVNQNMFVEGIGEVTSPWTTLGVSQILSNAWNLDSILSMSLFGLFGVLWMFSHLRFERSRLAVENDILYFLGWTRNSIRMKNMTEKLLIVMVASFISLILALSTRMNSLAFMVIGVFFLIMVLLIGIVFIMNPRDNTRLMGYKAFASIQYYHAMLIPTMLVLLLSVCITQIQLSAIYELWSSSVVTTLGDFVFNQGLSIRVSVIIVTVIVSLIALIEAIRAIIFARQEEFDMYYVIGWTEKMVQRHFLKEVMIWTSISLVLGLLIGTTVSMLLGLSSMGVLIGLAVVSFVYYLLVLTVVMLKKYR